MGGLGFIILPCAPSDLTGRETFQQKFHFTRCQLDCQRHEDFRVLI